MAKLYAAEVAMEVTTKAVQLHGGYGYTREYDVETHDARREDYRNLRGNIVKYQRMVISRKHSEISR